MAGACLGEQPVPGIGIDAQGEVPGPLAVVFKGRLGKTYPGTDTDRPSVSDKPAEIRRYLDGRALESRGSDTCVRTTEIEGSADIALRRSVGGTEEECGNHSENCFKVEKTTLHLNNHWLGNGQVNFSAKSIPASPARTGPSAGPIQAKTPLKCSYRSIPGTYTSTCDAATGGEWGHAKGDSAMLSPFAWPLGDLNPRPTDYESAALTN